MQVAAKFGKGKAGVIDKPDPKAAGEFVVVKVHVAPLCTEYHGFHDEGSGDSFGHEAAGEVVEVAQSGTVKVGDRVVVMPQYPCGKCSLCLSGEYIHCQNNQDVGEVTGSPTGTATCAQYLLKQDWMLVPIPDGMSYDHASLACCGLGPTFNAMKLMSVEPFDTVLITGMGPVGLGGVLNARYRGARVIAVESHPHRAELAKTLGAEAVVNPKDEDAVDQVKALTGGLGADKGLDTSGTAPAKPFLINSARSKGKVAFVGWGGEVDASAIIGKGLSVYGAWHFNLGDSPHMMQMISELGPVLDKFITHTFPMKDIEKAWEVQCTGNCGKVLLHPWK